MTDGLDERLRRIRGDSPEKRHNARTISALTSNPGCNRRAIMDAAGIDKPTLAQHIGFPLPFGQSQFAIVRGNIFEAQVKADGCAELITLLREHLKLSLPEVSYEDLNEVGGNDDNRLRHRDTRTRLCRQEEPGTLFDHPMLTLTVAGRDVFLEPDLICFQIKGKYHIVEIKSFAVIDGQADGSKVAAAAIQSAVYVIALRNLLASRSIPADAVSDDVILVTPKDFSNRPVATFVDVRKQLTVLRRQLSRLTSIDALLSLVPERLSLDVARPAAAVVEDLRSIEARYMPECLNTCELARFCRHECRGTTRAMGRDVAEELGSVETVDTALQLARGTLPPAPEQVEATRMLRLAWSMRQESLGSAA
ncbi:MAG TPA: hypothetical protein VH561_04965 [Micromonosporaceae bacterium]|jgi:hypothetical protein